MRWIIVLFLLSTAVNADVVRCEFGTHEFTIIMPSENDMKKYIVARDYENNDDELELLAMSYTGKVIDKSFEHEAIAVSAFRGWREVVWFEHDRYSNKIVWDPTGLRKDVLTYDYENTTPEERQKILEENTKKNKGYAEYSYGRTVIEGKCK